MIGGGLAGTLGGGSGAGGLAAGGAAAPLPAEEDRQVAGVSESVKGEFRSALHRFATVISHTIQQVSGDVRLDLPAADVSDPVAAAQDEGVKALLIDAVEDWTRVIGSVLSVVSDKEKGSRPIQEVEFWRGRNATLSTIWEQLSTPAVKNILATLELAREPALEAFRSAHGELSKAYVEARDNVKFLSTLERHFKNLSTGSLGTILETIPSLINGLRMVWIISRHYNTDEQMLPLMKRIVNELTDKVASEVNVKGILRLAKTEPAEALEVMGQAKAVLDSWHATYLTVRERLEKSADHRW
jgi:dynein heavy chain